MFAIKLIGFLLLWLFILYLIQDQIGWKKKQIWETFEPEAYNSELTYANKGDKPWDRHPIQESLPINHNIRYPNTYYYELDNDTYEKGLQVALSTSTHKSKLQMIEDDSLWLGPYDPAVSDPSWHTGYTYLINHYLPGALNNTITTSLCLPAEGDNKTIIQIVHDRWRRVYMMQKDPNIARMDIELLLYREEKYQAKHVLITVWCEQKNGIYDVAIVSARVVGVVPSESIGMFPVVASNPFERMESKFDDDPYNFAPTLLISDEEVLKEIKRKKDNIEKHARASFAIGQSIMKS